MTTLLIVNFVFLILGLGAVIAALLILIKRINKNKENDTALILLQNQINKINETLDLRLSESGEVLRKQFSESSRLIKEITEELTKVGEGQKQVFDLAKQLEQLQDILKNPKHRGILGEYYLEVTLKNFLPANAYQLQYELGKDENGQKLIVDAAIFIKDKIIPVDSKFSLENYNRLLTEIDPNRKKELEKSVYNDLKIRINETSKYIQPKKGTTDFAFMFIPSEALYYDLLINKVGSMESNTRDLIEYAVREKRVIIVSATTFAAYLQTVLQGLRAFQIEESAKEIIKKVEELRKHLANYELYMEKLGNNLSTTVNTYNSAHKEFVKIDKDVLKISGEGFLKNDQRIIPPPEIEEK
ncbi:MAG: DNA recombination protein RmuC [Minisyncoccia bacterium]